MRATPLALTVKLVGGDGVVLGLVGAELAARVGVAPRPDPRRSESIFNNNKNDTPPLIGASTCELPCGVAICLRLFLRILNFRAERHIAARERIVSSLSHHPWAYY